MLVQGSLTQTYQLCGGQIAVLFDSQCVRNLHLALSSQCSVMDHTPFALPRHGKNLQVVVEGEQADDPFVLGVSRSCENRSQLT